MRAIKPAFGIALMIIGLLIAGASLMVSYLEGFQSFIEEDEGDRLVASRIEILFYCAVGLIVVGLKLTE